MRTMTREEVFDKWMRETKMHDWTDDMSKDDWKDRAYKRALEGKEVEAEYTSKPGYLEGYMMGLSMRAIKSMTDKQ